MEIVNIEARTYEAVVSRFEAFARSVEALCERNGGRELKQWLSGQDVCVILNVSKRTLQSLRDSGRLGYSTIGHKTFYKPRDVERLIADLSAKAEREVRDE